MARGMVVMAENFELLETGQIEIMHEQVHNRLDAGEDTCDELRVQHDGLAAELVKRGLPHDTEIICPEIETDAPNYRRGFTGEFCTNCAFGQLFPFCNLYKFDYIKEHVCDSWNYFEVLELEPPHGFLMMNGKQTAWASVEHKAIDKPFLIVSGGEVFGIAEFDEPAQLKTKEFDLEDWVNRHRVTQRERRQWWPSSETFYVYRLKNWHPYEGVKLFEDGKVINEPKLTAKQWQLVSKSKELPKQITLIDDAVSITEGNEFIIDQLVDRGSIENILSATYETNVKDAKNAKEVIPVYSLALVRNPRMRVSKKNELIGHNDRKQEEIEARIMPFNIVTRDDQFCVINTETEEVMGCHDTEAEADDQLTALNINVTAEEKNKPYKKPEKRNPKKKKDVSFLDGLKSLYKSIADFLSVAENENDFAFDSDIGIAQKTVNGELWHFTWSTNAFKDREGEIFSTKSLENYAIANEVNEDKGFFNLWHINAEDGHFNTDFAVKRWQGVVGRFLVEAGPYFDNEKGQAAKKFFAEFASGHPEIAPEGWGCSPEYKYLPEERATTIYENIWITRTSTLPKMEAANVWTKSGQLKRGSKMALSKEQMTAAIEIFGQEFADSMVAEGESKTAELEGAGVAHKDVKPDNNSEVTQEAQEVAITQDQFEILAEQVAKQFNVNNDAIVEAMANMAEGLKDVMDRVGQLESQSDAKGKAEVPSFTFSLQRASESDQTIVAEDDDLKNKKPKEVQGANDPSMITPAQFFGQN